MATIAALVSIGVIWGVMDAETGDKLTLTITDLFGILLILFGPKNEPVVPQNPAPAPNTKLGMFP